MEKTFLQTFAPNKIEDMVLPDRIKNQLLKGPYTHFLFYGPAGTGKSQCAKILANDYVYKYVNVSMDGKMENLREEIQDFCINQQFTTENKLTDKKIIIFDEMDGHSVSPAFYDALRGFMDEYESVVKFICTCNTFSKIPKPLKSRYDCIDFSNLSSEEEEYRREKYQKRIEGVVKMVGMRCEDGSLTKVIQDTYPDYRTIYQIIEKLYRTDIKVIDNKNLYASKYTFIELYDTILSSPKPDVFHTLLMGEYATKSIEVLNSLHEGMVDYILKKRTDSIAMIPSIIVDTAYYIDMANRIDPALAMKACCFKLSKTAEQYKK